MTEKIRYYESLLEILMRGIKYLAMDEDKFGYSEEYYQHINMINDIQYKLDILNGYIEE